MCLTFCIEILFLNVRIVTPNQIIDYSNISILIESERTRRELLGILEMWNKSIKNSSQCFEHEMFASKIAKVAQKKEVKTTSTSIRICLKRS